MPTDAAQLADLAVAALGEVTDPATVGPLVDVVEREPGVVDLGFACLLPGYPDWRWTVSTARLEGADPTVLEVELLPGDGSVLAPPWVPWTERLAEYRRTHAGGVAIDGAEAEPSDGGAPDEDEDEDLDEDEDEDLDEDADLDDDGDLDDDEDLDDDGDLEDDDEDDDLDDEDLDDDADADDLDDDPDDDLDDGVDVEAAAEETGTGEAGAERAPGARGADDDAWHDEGR